MTYFQNKAIHTVRFQEMKKITDIVITQFLAGVKTSLYHMTPDNTFLFAFKFLNFMGCDSSLVSSSKRVENQDIIVKKTLRKLKLNINMSARDNVT